MMNDILNFINKIKQNTETVSFLDTIAIIDSNYNFTPTAFKNGNQFNNSNENNGSCKIFAFAKINNLEKDETLSLFGSYYFDDVLKNPDGIRLTIKILEILWFLVGMEFHLMEKLWS